MDTASLMGMDGLGREPLTVEDCLDFDPAEPHRCGGKVEYRMSLSPSGRPFPRCDTHWDARLAWQEEHTMRYPDSDIPPSDFDPLYAGERWDDEY